MRKSNLYEAGRMEGVFFTRAVENGRPATTADLVRLSTTEELKKIVVENALDRARAYLSAEEIGTLKTGLSDIVGRKPTEKEIGQYALGKINGYSTADTLKAHLSKAGKARAGKPAAVAASRENGKKGGRPKKPVADK